MNAQAILSLPGISGISSISGNGIPANLPGHDWSAYTSCLSHFNTRSQRESAPTADQTRAFICARYRHHFGAEITCDYPQLIATCDAQGKIVAACGLRTADQPLFLERYLDAPVEQVLSTLFRKSLDRRHIAEIGNLVSVHRDATPLLFKMLWKEMHRQDVSHAIVTCTRNLKARFRSLTLVSLGNASEQCLTEQERACWGSYYSHDPEMLSAPIGSANLLLRFVRNKGNFTVHHFGTPAGTSR